VSSCPSVRFARAPRAGPPCGQSVKQRWEADVLRRVAAAVLVIALAMQGPSDPVVPAVALALQEPGDPLVVVGCVPRARGDCAVAELLATGAREPQHDLPVC
jgi:hypothetical protein